jgi:hypothetical protein
MHAELDRRFDATVSAVDPPPRDPSWPALALPPPLRESLAEAGARGALPDAVIDHYTRLMPSLLIEQLRADDVARALLFRPLMLEQLPRLGHALDGLYAALADAGLDAAAFVGAASPAALVAARPTAGALYAHTLFGSGLPLLGLYPADRAALAGELERHGADAVLDLRLSSHLVHEICHGPPVATGLPWMIAEAAATHLGAAAREAHLFPDEPGEALRGVLGFVLIGEVLARRCGRAALWRCVAGVPFAEALPPALATALVAAGWEDWCARQEAPFARDALGAFAWLKLIDGARTGAPMTLATASRCAWRELPWWSDPVEAADRAMVPRAVASLFYVNAMVPSFQTVPSEPPHGRLWLDVAEAYVRAEPRPDGVFAEPAAWIFPPPLARRLDERGARCVRIEGATRARRAAIAAALVELCDGARALPEEVVLSWACSR